MSSASVKNGQVRMMLGRMATQDQLNEFSGGGDFAVTGFGRRGPPGGGIWGPERTMTWGDHTLRMNWDDNAQRSLGGVAR